MPAHAAFADAVTFQAIVNRTGVVAGGNLAYQFAGHRALHPPVLLKEPVTLQRGFTGCFVAQPGTLDRHFASVKDDVAGLGAVTIMGLLAPGAAAPLDLLAHIAVHDLEAEIGADRFDVVFHFQDQVQHREVFLQRCRFRRFEAGFCQQIAVLSFHAFGVFGFVFHSPPSLSARRPNHQSHFQLRCGHSRNEFPPIKWIIHGAHDEDDRLRFADHFYTLTPERVPGQVNGLTDKSETLYLEVLLFGINTLTNSFAWGTAPGIQVPLIFPILGTNAETWACARSYEYAALTNITLSDRDANMAHMFYALGHILHLNQPAAVAAVDSLTNET